MSALPLCPKTIMAQPCTTGQVCPQPAVDDLDVSRETCHARSMIISAARVDAAIRAARVAAVFAAAVDHEEF